MSLRLPSLSAARHAKLPTSPCLHAVRRRRAGRWCGALCIGALLGDGALADAVPPAAPAPPRAAPAAASADPPAPTLEGEALALAAPGRTPAAAAPIVAAEALAPAPDDGSDARAGAQENSAPALRLHGPLASYRAAPLGGMSSLPGLLPGGQWHLSSSSGWQGPLATLGGTAPATAVPLRDGVTFEWSPSPGARWAIARGGLRLKFDAHSSLSLRVRRSGFGAYWRARF